MPRSGTTALFSKLQSSMPPETVCLFEPAEYRPDPEHRNRPVLAKVLMRLANPRRGGGYDGWVADHASFQHFDKKILLVRDPRDNLVSSMLYLAIQSPVPRPRWSRQGRRYSRFFALLRQKEKDPPSISFLELLDAAERTFDWPIGNIFLRR